MAPPDVALSPGGNPVIVQAYGDTPPVAATCAVYATPTCPFGRLVVLTVSGPATTVNVNCLDALPLLLSATLAVKVNCPGVVGVPLKAPLGPPASCIPGGAVPVNE